MQIISINTAVRDACITGDLHTAEIMLTEEIQADGNNHKACANRSFVMAQKGDWDSALHDALSVRYTPL